MLCYPHARHGGSAGPTRQWGGKGIPSISGRLGEWERRIKCESSSFECGLGKSLDYDRERTLAAECPLEER